MVKKLSAEDRSRLERALSAWELWRPAPGNLPEVVSQLGGDSNLSFLVSDAAMRWVVRLNNPNTDSGISRDNERLALLAAHEAGIAPMPSFQSSDALVTPFVSGQHATLDNLPRIGALFNQIHALSVNLEPINLRQHLHNYYELASPDPMLRDCYQRAMELYPEDAVELKPCHNDCLLPNIIESEQGVMLIDWEYAAAADPAYDLAVFSGTYSLGRECLVKLLVGYGVEGEGLISRVKYFEKYYRLIEILWWQLRGRGMEAELIGLVEDLA